MYIRKVLAVMTLISLAPLIGAPQTVHTSASTSQGPDPSWKANVVRDGSAINILSSSLTAQGVSPSIPFTAGIEARANITDLTVAGWPGSHE
jgi:hypothetical protein